MRKEKMEIEKNKIKEKQNFRISVQRKTKGKAEQ